MSRPIKVNVAGRILNMTVDGLAEEEIIRKAEEQVAEKMRMFGRSYQGTDRNDLLCMVLLQFATEAVDGKQDAKSMENDLSTKLKAISDRIGSALV